MRDDEDICGKDQNHGQAKPREQNKRCVQPLPNLP
jgi:hypothetical protein